MKRKASTFTVWALSSEGIVGWRSGGVGGGGGIDGGGGLMGWDGGGGVGQVRQANRGEMVGGRRWG